MSLTLTMQYAQHYYSRETEYSEFYATFEMRNVTDTLSHRITIWEVRSNHRAGIWSVHLDFDRDTRRTPGKSIFLARLITRCFPRTARSTTELVWHLNYRAYSNTTPRSPPGRVDSRASYNTSRYRRRKFVFRSTHTHVRSHIRTHIRTHARTGRLGRATICRKYARVSIVPV